MSQVTHILNLIKAGDPLAANDLLPLVYDELRKLAKARMRQEAPNHTLGATALVHEAYLRLVGNDSGQAWENKGHFFAAAAEAMRRILINHARDKATIKRGIGWQRISLDNIVIPGAVDPAKFFAFNDTLDRLVELDPQAGEVAKLRIFAGLTIPEIAEVLNLGARTVDRLWAFARAWLRTQISDN